MKTYVFVLICREILCLPYAEFFFFITFQLSALHRIEVQCNSMDKNVDQCSAVECTAAHPRLTKSPKTEEEPL